MAFAVVAPPVRQPCHQPSDRNIFGKFWRFDSKQWFSIESALSCRRQTALPRFGRPLLRRRQRTQLHSNKVTTEPASLSQLGKQVIAVAGPNTGAFLLQLVNEQTNVIMLGQTGSRTALAAVGLGNMMQNCVGLSIGWGVLGAMDTLVSQAHGAGSQDEALNHFQRGRLIATAQLLWIVPLLMLSERLLLAVGQSHGVSQLAGAYNTASAPALFCLFQFQAISKFLQNQRINAPPLFINLGCSILHVAWCGIFVAKLGLGNAGAGYANAATWTCQWLLISTYVFLAGRKHGLPPRGVLLPSRAALRGWRGYLRVALPCVLQTSSEWWFWELCALAVGYLGTLQLAAHVAASQFVAMVFMPSIGISSAAATLVGNSLGAGAPQDAKRFAYLCIALNLGSWTAIASIMVFGRRHLASIYVPAGSVSDLMQALLVIYACAGFFDTTQNVMAGALRGMGKIAVTSFVYIFAYYGMMLPVGCWLAFKGGFGVKGLWYAFGLGTSIAVLVFGAVLRRTKFELLASNISKKANASEN